MLCRLIIAEQILAGQSREAFDELSPFGLREKKRQPSNRAEGSHSLGLKMSREIRALEKDKWTAHEDRQKKTQIKQTTRKRAREEQSKPVNDALAQADKKLIGARFLLHTQGFSNITIGSTFTPRFDLQTTGVTFSLLRSQVNLKEVIFRVVPVDLWRVLFEQLNSRLAALAERQRQTASARRDSSPGPRSSKTSGPSHRMINESEFWLMWSTNTIACRLQSKSIEDLFEETPPGRQRKMLSKLLFTNIRGSIALDNLNDFTDRLSRTWTGLLQPSGAFVIDESLWKFKCRTNSTENLMVVRTIPRKPAKTGLLAYELASFTSHSKLPYVHAIAPVTIAKAWSPNDAADHLINLYEDSKPKTAPHPPVLIADSAFTSAAALKNYAKWGWLFCCSMSAKFYQQLALVMPAELQCYEYRILRDVAGDKTVAAYCTQFTPTDKQAERGSGAGNPLQVTNISNAYHVSHPLLPDEDAGSADAPVELGDRTSPAASPSSSTDLPVSPPVIRPSEVSCSSSSRLVISLPGRQVAAAIASPAPPPATLTSSSDATSVDSDEPIEIQGNSYSRSQLRSLNKASLANLVKGLGISPGNRSRAGLAELLISAGSDQQFCEKAATLQHKAKRPQTAKVAEIMPMVQLYRDEFASVDKLDMFMSQVDLRIKFLSWQGRFIERIMMVAFHNARVLLTENALAVGSPPHPLRDPNLFLDALSDVFFELAMTSKHPDRRLLQLPRGTVPLPSSSNQTSFGAFEQDTPLSDW